jgi:hypothetical protein
MPQTVPQPGLGGTPPDPRPAHEQFIGSTIPQAGADLGRAVEEFQAQPTIQDKAGQVLGIFSHLANKQQGRVEQRLEDQNRYGDPDATLGGMGLDGGIAGVIADPSTLKNLPAAIGEVAARPEVLLDSMAMDAASSAGGLDKGKQSFEDWAAEDPARYEAARAQGEGVATQQWKEDTGRTLASGGPGGALSGAGYDIVTDPNTLAAPTVGVAARGVSKGLGLAGKLGLPAGAVDRGQKIVSGANTALQGAIDPTDLLVEPALRGLANKATGGLTSLTKSAQQERVVGGMDEALGTATRAVRQGGLANPPVAQTAAPPGSVPTGNGSVPPGTPLVPQQGAGIASQPVNGSAPPSPAAQPVPASATAPTRPPGAAPTPPPRNPFAANGDVGTIGGTRPARNAPARPLDPLMRNGDAAKGGRWVDPKTGQPASLEGTWNSLVEVKPEEIRGFTPGTNVIPTPETAFTQHLAAATEQGKLYNDRPSTRAGTPQQKQAGRNWVRLMSDRIKAHGAPEVERLVREYQAQQADPYYRSIAKARGSEGAYWEDRANAILEAAQRADATPGVDVPAFTLRRGGSGSTAGKPYTFKGSTAALPIRSAEAVQSTPTDIWADPLGSTLGRFDTSSKAVRLKMAGNLDAVMSIADWNSPAAKKARQPFYNPNPTGTKEPAWAQKKDKWPDAYNRYQAVRSLHTNIHGPAAGDTVFRRGTVGTYGDLTPEERAVAEGMATEFRAHLDSMNLGHVHLAMVDAVSDVNPMTQQANLAGFDPENDAIELAIKRTYDAIAEEGGIPDAALVKRVLYQSLNHEAFHALRTKGVIQPQEWDILVREARARKYGPWADAEYADLAPAKRDEEAIAEMFGDFANDTKALSPATRTIFQKVVDFFAGFIRTLSGNQTGADVMTKMLSGKVGSRSGGVNTPGTSSPPLFEARKAVGPMAQRYTGEGYHASPHTSLNSISADPALPGRNPDSPMSRLGAFFSTNARGAQRYAPDTAGLYRTALDLKNPADFSRDSYLDWDANATPEDVDALRQQLLDDGHDGIVFSDENGDPFDVVSFTDVPVNLHAARQHPSRWTLQPSARSRVRRFESKAQRAKASALTPLTEEDPRVHNLPFDNPTKGFLLNEIEYKGKKTALIDISVDVNREVNELHGLAAAKATATPQDPFLPRDEKRLAHLTRQYDAYDPQVDWADEALLPNSTVKRIEPELERIAREHTRLLWEKAVFPPGVKKPTSVLGGAGQLVKDVTAFNRSLRLTGIANAPQQAVRQLFGNVMTAIIAAPEGAVEMFKPKAYLDIYKALRGRKGTRSSLGNFLVARGRSVPRTLDTASKSLATADMGIQNPLLKAIRDKVAWKPVADMVAVPDGVAREGLFRVHYVQPMKEELRKAPKMGAEVWGAYRSKLPAFTSREVEDVIRDTIKAKKVRGEPISRATGQDLKDALITAFKDKPLPGGGDQTVADKALRDFADRVGRNLNERDNLHFQTASQKVDKVFLSWENTNADEVANHILLYTYWASRTSGVYAKAMLQKPWMAAAMIELVGQVQQEAENGNYPEWMKGYTRLLNSPAGLTLFTNYLDAISTMFVFGEWQYGESFGEAMKGDLSALGEVRGVLPAVVAAPYDFALWASGAYGGEDARLPYNLTGLTGMTKRGAQIVNDLGYRGLLPAGMGQDAQGNFHPFSEVPLEEVAMQIGAFLGRPPVDLYASTQARVDMHLEQILLEDHPEWATDPTGEDQMRAAITQMKLDAEAGNWAPEYLEAEHLANGDALTGPDFPGLPEPLRGWVGGAVRALSPLRMMSEPEIKSQLRDGEMPVGVKDEWDAKNVKNATYDTLEMAVLNGQNEDYWNIGADTGLKDASRVYQSITNANFDGTLTIYGKSYTKEALVDGVMTETQRYDVANDYLASQGYTSSDLDDYYAAREAMEAAHPDLAAYHDFTAYTKEYQGGLPAFVDAAVRSSPSYARYMAQLPYPPGSAEYYAAGDTTDAFYALEGRRGSIYDPTVLPDTGTIPGQPPGMTFAMKRALEANADEAAAGGSGDGTTYDDFVGDVQKSVDDLYNAQQMLNEWFPGAGYVAGVTYFEYDTYEALKAAGYSVPKKGDIAYDYYDWLLGNPTTTDGSVKAFLDQRDRGSETGTAAAKQENVPFEMILAQRGGNVNVVDPSVPRADAGAIDTSQMQRVTPVDTTPDAGLIYSQPNLTQPTGLVVPSGQLLYVIEQHGDWAYVIAPGNQVGWIPTVALKHRT